MPKMSTRRKLAIATWSAPREGNIYGKLTVDATHVLAYLERAETGEKVTITHFVGKVVGAALRDAPGLNGFLRFGAFHHHSTVDVAFLVALDEGSDLGKVKVERVDEKRLEDIAREFGAAAAKLRAGKDKEFKKSNNLARMVLPLLDHSPTGHVHRLADRLAGCVAARRRARGLPLRHVHHHQRGHAGPRRGSCRPPHSRACPSTCCSRDRD